jgi:hypothetical protein
LCLNDSQMKLLRSRGGNAEGGDFQYAWTVYSNVISHLTQ